MRGCSGACTGAPRPGLRCVVWPSRRFTAHLLLYISWVIFTYMFLLTLFELIELLRPKRLGPAVECSDRSRVLCPVCSRIVLCCVRSKHTMKTAITVLQEMMMKLGVTPEYECISQSGPHHQAMFEYVCTARGLTARGSARSKKEAKQEAARALLLRLAEAGEPVPAEYGAGAAAAPPAPPRSYVALLKELCEEYKLPGADYALVGDTGPPHLRQFTMRATLGQHARVATATTKKTARQQAAEELYHYLRDNLKLTRDFVEEEALVRHHEKVMERYRESRSEQLARPRLAQRVADYHLGLHDTFESSARALAVEALAGTRGRGGEVELGCAAGALEMTAAWAELPREGAPALHVVTLAPSAPALAFAGESRDEAAAAAAAYLRRALPDPAPAPDHASATDQAPATDHAPDTDTAPRDLLA